MKYTRYKNSITNLETKQIKSFKSVNEAKKESRRIQMDVQGGLGRGVLGLK